MIVDTIEYEATEAQILAANNVTDAIMKFHVPAADHNSASDIVTAVKKQFNGTTGTMVEYMNENDIHVTSVTLRGEPKAVYKELPADGMFV